MSPSNTIPAGAGRTEQVQRWIDEAVAAAVERCAKIAEANEECAASLCCGAKPCDGGDRIAVKIRSVE